MCSTLITVLLLFLMLSSPNAVSSGCWFNRITPMNYTAQIKLTKPFYQQKQHFSPLLLLFRHWSEPQSCSARHCSGTRCCGGADHDSRLKGRPSPSPTFFFLTHSKTWDVGRRVCQFNTRIHQRLTKASNKLFNFREWLILWLRKKKISRVDVGRLLQLARAA